jgi:cation diffusion facilitator CzcD-associated flavoprotein CzcO
MGQQTGWLAMSDSRKNPSVVVIGAGMTGIMLVVKLRQAGIINITLLEKKDSVGGTWRENTYPGVACDVPGHAYTYSFAPNPEWSSLFAPGSEIHQYFIDVYQKYGVDTCTHFNEAVTSCVYGDGKWTVESSKGNTYVADLVFAATGMLHHPVTPDFPGLDAFNGVKMHSAQWDHTVDLEGKRIGVIGNGSSGAQLIPELINKADTDVTVFQRTPQWLIKVVDKPYSEKDKMRFRKKPVAMQRVKDAVLFIYGKGTAALASDSPWYRIVHKGMAWNARRYLNSSIKDPELRAKLTPDYKLGCKRVVMNSTFYEAIQKSNAHLVTDGIERIEAGGVRTVDGQFHPLDALVFATGFDPLAYMRPMNFVGRAGLSIKEAWADKIQAYRSLCLAGFPNFFLMLGPNSPIGNYSVIAISEMQADYALQLVSQWQAGQLETIEVKPEAVQGWSAMLQEKMGHTVWASGCNSWYLDGDGDPLLWPGNWKQWVAEMRSPEIGDFYAVEPCEEGVEQAVSDVA